MPARPRFRFAPSPNGRLHLGHAYSALFTQQSANELGGTTLLRIEDIDTTRSRPEFIDGIFEDLDWIGFTWSGKVRRQSAHFADYVKMSARLDDLGLLYPCTASRAEIARAINQQTGKTPWPRDPDGSPLYPGIFRNMNAKDAAKIRAETRPHALRLNMKKAHQLAVDKNNGPIFFTEQGAGPQGQTGRIEVDPEIWGDVILARKDVPTSYHLSVVSDDALQNISHVTRGQDLFHTTSVHRLLQILLDLREPFYRHHVLIRDEAGRKLSKSARDTSLLSLRESGIKPLELRKFLGFS